MKDRTRPGMPRGKRMHPPNMFYLVEAVLLIILIIWCLSSGLPQVERSTAPPALTDIDTARWAARAKQARQGLYPRHLLGLQSFWTVIGAAGDREEALINEEGMVEVGRQKFSIEPFLYADGDLLTWHEGRHEQLLEHSYLPMPTVTRFHQRVSLAITAWVAGEAGKSTLYIRYKVSNISEKPLHGKLFLALRPVQVNPPWQKVITPGGLSPIYSVHRSGRVYTVNGSTWIHALTYESGGRFVPEKSGDITAYLLQDALPPHGSSIEDPRGTASGALEYRIELAAGGLQLIDLAVPFYKESRVVAPEVSFSETVAWWKDKLDAIRLTLPASDRKIEDTIKSTLAYIMINRDGPSIQPGSRAYKRSWIRDGTLTATALLQFGYTEEVRRFIEWFASHQFENGAVPCCIDQRGADHLVENDSHGEFIYLIAEYYRYTRDIRWLSAMLPRVDLAVNYIDELRQTRRTAEYRDDAEKRHFYGLLPESISHEGYNVKPMHSYFDDLFALKGLKDAVFIAATTGEDGKAAAYAAILEQFRRDLVDSIRLTMQKHAINYIPGCAELGDFDPTSTTIAIDPVDELHELRAALENTFERYWTELKARRSGALDWQAYTPYEHRSVGAFIRLRQKERAHALLDYLFQHQRPKAWNHWAEVVYSDREAGLFIGDMPHTWVGSDFLRSVRSMLVYERESDRTLVVGAGLNAEWLAQGLSFQLPTHYGTLALQVRSNGNTTAYSLSGALDSRIALVLPTADVDVKLNGKLVQAGSDREVVIELLPAYVVISRND